MSPQLDQILDSPALIDGRSRNEVREKPERIVLAIAYGALGDHVAAQEALATTAKQAPDFARDPAAAFRRFLPLDSIVDPLMDGLRKAGWKEPVGSPTL